MEHPELLYIELEPLPLCSPQRMGREDHRWRASRESGMEGPDPPRSRSSLRRLWQLPGHVDSTPPHLRGEVLPWRCPPGSIGCKLHFRLLHPSIHHHPSHQALQGHQAPGRWRTRHKQHPKRKVIGRRRGLLPLRCCSRCRQRRHTRWCQLCSPLPTTVQASHPLP